MAAPLISDVVTLPLICLHLTDYLPSIPVSPRLSPPTRVSQPGPNQIYTWIGALTLHPNTTHPSRLSVLTPLWGWASSSLAGYTKCRHGRATWQHTPSGRNPILTQPALTALLPPSLSSMPSCSTSHLPRRDPSSSKGPRSLVEKPRSGRTSKCLLALLSLYALRPQVSLQGCHHSPPPFTLRQSTPSLPFLPTMPRVLESSP